MNTLHTYINVTFRRKTFITVTSFLISLFARLQTHNQPCSWLIDEVGRVKSDSTFCPHVAAQPADFGDSVHRDFSLWVGGYMAATIIYHGGWQLKNTWYEGTPVSSGGVDGVFCWF